MRSNPLPGRVQQQNSDEAKRLCAIAEVWIPGINTYLRTILNASLPYLTELIGIIGPSLCLVKPFSGGDRFFLNSDFCYRNFIYPIDSMGYVDYNQ